MKNAVCIGAVFGLAAALLASASLARGVARADDYIAPSPVYGYYLEGGVEELDWLEPQLPVFAEHGLTLFLGIGDDEIGDSRLLEFLRTAQREGVEVRAWLLLPFEYGYWPNEYNAEMFAGAALNAARWFTEEGLPIDWIVVDMELGYQKLMEVMALAESGDYGALAGALLGNLDPVHFVRASAVFQQLVDDLHGRGFHVMVVTYPQVLDDLSDWDCSLQDLLDIPVSTVAWDEVSTMVYTTMFSEVGEALFGTPFGPDLVYSYARSTVQAFGMWQASIALGIAADMTGPEQLEEEVAAAKAAGIQRIQVYSYRGVHAASNEDAWHEAFLVPEAVPEPEPAVGAMRSLLQLADRIL